MKLRVVTYNIQHGHPYVEAGFDSINLSLFADTIRCLQPDVLGLNEVRGEGTSPNFRAQAQWLADALGYHAFFAPAIEVPNGGPYGNAILTKVPIECPAIVPIPDPVRDPSFQMYETRCLAKAHLPIGGGITLLVTHFGLHPNEAENAVRTVCSEIRASRYPVILTGDFNLTPDSRILQPIRELLKDTADSFSCPMLSYPSDRPHSKIDYIFVSSEFQTCFAAIPPVVASDHRPYVADLEWNV